MANRYVVDRFEGDVAVLTPRGGGAPRDIARSELPAGTRPGTTLVDDDGTWQADEVDTVGRAERIHEKMARLFSR